MKMLQKYHYLYKTTNMINSKYYYGMHSTSKLDDGYLGSGKYLRRAIRKYGKKNFKLEVLEFFENRDDLIQAEIKLITEQVIDDKLCMNLKPGGNGGFISIEQQKQRSICGGNAHANKIKTDVVYANKVKAILLNNALIAHKNGKIKYDTFTGKTHSEETKKKMSESSKGMCLGKKNDSFGTCWITNQIENKKIKKDDLDSYLLSGWVKGRKL